MFGDFLTIEPERHEILKDGAWIKNVRQVVHNKNLFVYRHRIEKDSFVVCEWMDEPHTCTELFVVDAPPDHSPTNMPDMPTIIHRCRPMEMMFKDMRDKIDKRDYKMATNVEESNQQREQAAVYLDRTHLEEAAIHHREGCAPYASEGESSGMMGETIEKLNDAASTKTYSSGVVGEKRAKHKMK